MCVTILTIILSLMKNKNMNSIVHKDTTHDMYYSNRTPCSFSPANQHCCFPNTQARMDFKHITCQRQVKTLVTRVNKQKSFNNLDYNLQADWTVIFCIIINFLTFLKVHRTEL